MINLRILTHTIGNFATEKLFVEYLNNLDLDSDEYMAWTNTFYKYDNNNLLTEDDAILFVYNGLIYAKGIIYKHIKNEIIEIETLENGYINNYKSKTYFKEIIKIPKIDIHEFCDAFDIKLGNGVGKIEVDENILDEYFEEYVEFSEKKEYLIKKDKSIEILCFDFEEQNYNYIAPHNFEKRENIIMIKADYKKAYDNKEKTGNDGENAILNFEIKKLKDAGRYDLAKQVDRVSLKSDAFGYDIKSFDIDGSEIHIEVKTTRRGKGYLDFYLTENELKNFIEDPLHKIYYVFDLDTKRPKYHIINKETFLNKKEEFLKPVLYRVMIDVDN